MISNKIEFAVPFFPKGPGNAVKPRCLIWFYNVTLSHFKKRNNGLTYGGNKKWKFYGSPMKMNTLKRRENFCFVLWSS